MKEKLLLNALRGKSSSSVPFWLMRQAGRYLPEYRKIREEAGSFLDLCYTPELAAEVTLQPIRRFGMDAAIIFSDILVVPHAMGAEVNFIEGKGPVVTPIRMVETIRKLVAGGDPLHQQLAPVYEAIRLVRQQLPQGVALIGFAGAPWTVSTYMIEGGAARNFETVKHFVYAQPEAYRYLIDKLINATAEYLIAQVEAGAEVLQIFDSWSGVLGENDFGLYAVEPTKRIVERVREVYPEVPIIGFPKGASFHYDTYVKETRVDAISLDYTVPLHIAKNLQNRCPVQGNLDPALLASDIVTMRREAERILSALADGPFIFNLGHGILPDTPIPHVEALAETIRHWRSDAEQIPLKKLKA